MADRFLTDFELLVMLAVLRVRDDAYGVPIARAIEEHTGRTVTLAAVSPFHSSGPQASAAPPFSSFIGLSKLERISCTS